MTPHPRRVAIIQARMSSTRFPGKVLAELGGLPMIVFMVERLRRAQRIDHLLVATSTHSSDDALSRVLAEHEIACFRGNLEDVLDRFYRAAVDARADHVVRLTGDCPLMDADLVDRGLGMLAVNDADYVSNTAPPTYPDGLDVECFTMAALKTAWLQARLPSEREHVTPFIRNVKGGQRLRSWRAVADFSALRWTVDHPDDLTHVRSLVQAVASRSGEGHAAAADRFDFLRALERDGVASAGRYGRNEGYGKSLAEDSPMRT